MKLFLPILLGILFVTLRMCNVTNWSWIWVLFTIWVSWALICLALGLGWVIGKMIKRLEAKIEKEMTPEQRVARACGEMSAALRRNRS